LSELDALVATLTGSRPASTAARVLAMGLVPDRLLPDDTVVGLGWATVDTERTLDDLRVSGAAGRSLAWSSPTDEPAVGASAVVARLDDLALVVLEPATEARLAASLARYGERLCLVYVRGGGPGGMRRPTALGVLGRLRPHVHPWGPYVIAIEAG
jgi:hypothetical protein